MQTPHSRFPSHPSLTYAGRNYCSCLACNFSFLQNGKPVTRRQESVPWFGFITCLGHCCNITQNPARDSQVPNRGISVSSSSSVTNRFHFPPVLFASLLFILLFTYMSPDSTKRGKSLDFKESPSRSASRIDYRL